MLIPLPFLSALVSAALALRLAMLRALPLQSRGLFGALAVISAYGSVLVGLRYGYGLDGLAPFHRVVPFFLGPLLHLGFAAMAAPLSRWALLGHLGGAVLAAGVFSALLDLLDLAIALSYLVYLALLWRTYRGGPDALARLPTDLTQPMWRWCRGAMVLLAVVLVLETTVAVMFMSGFGAYVPQLIAVGSLPITAGLFVAALNVPVAAQVSATVSPEGLDDIDAYLSASEAFRDPELSLAKLARGLGQPIKSVSQRINAGTGSSVSTYINRKRVEAAARQLRETRDKVEVVGQDCGFLSRSNFYRAFQEAHDMTPAAYRRAAAGGALTR